VNGLDTFYYVTTAVGGVYLATVGAFVLLVGPTRPINRILSAFLVGVAFASNLLTFAPWVPDRVWSYDGILAGYALVPALFSGYLLFTGLALQTRLAAPLRHPVVRTILVVVAIAGVALAAISPGLLAVGPGTLDDLGRWNWNGGPLGSTYGLVFSISYIFTIACAISAVFATPRGSPARRRALAYAAGFVLIDAEGFLLWGGGITIPESNLVSTAVDLAAAPVWIIGLSILVGGMLRYQLFDFDLKLKWTLKRGTLVAIMLGAFFVVTALAEQYLQQFGWIVGGLAVGALLFALRPIERAIDRMADRAMPKTTGTPEYLAQRKHEIYRAAIEEANADGAVNSKERRLLIRLASDLELSGDDAQRIEREVLEASA
jgi:hypothetical protein